MTAETPAGASAAPAPADAFRNAAFSIGLTWLLPGSGHFFLGRRRRALLYGGIILFMFWLGLFLDGSVSKPAENSYLSKLATLADLGAGPSYVLARVTDWGEGVVTSATHEIGNAFHWSAGVMNMLLMLDAADIAFGRK